MKKIYSLMAGLVFGTTLFALPVGNAADPMLLKEGLWTYGEDCWGLDLGYRGDFVFDRKMKFRFGAEGSVADYSLFTNAGVLTLNLWEQVDIYGWLGATQANATFVTPPLGEIARSEFVWETDHHLSYGFGLKAILWSCNRTTLSLDAQYARFQVDVDKRIQGGQFLDFGSFFVTSGGHFSQYEYQVALDVSHRIYNLIPYLAIKYSNARGKFVQNAPEPIGQIVSKFKSRKNWGFVAGVTLVDWVSMDVTAEARFVDEKALSIFANVRF